MNDKPTHDDLMEWIRRRSDARWGPDGEIIEPTLNTREEVYKELIASVAEFNVRITDYNRRMNALEPNSEEAIEMTPVYLSRIRSWRIGQRLLKRPSRTCGNLWKLPARQVSVTHHWAGQEYVRQ